MSVCVCVCVCVCVYVCVCLYYDVPLFFLGSRELSFWQVLVCDLTPEERERERERER